MIVVQMFLVLKMSRDICSVEVYTVGCIDTLSLFDLYDLVNIGIGFVVACCHLNPIRFARKCEELCRL